MAHIPYGYRIENGKAVIDAERAAQVRGFFDAYLSGLSIENALEQVGIATNHTTGGAMLKRKTYLGNSYYPRIIDDDTFNAVAEERARRKVKMGREHMPSRTIKPVPVMIRFRITIPTHGGCEQYLKEHCENRSAVKKHSKLCDQGLTPAERAQLLYSCIIPDENGDTAISVSDKDALREWISET